jgi:hypothetical protein
VEASKAAINPLVFRAKTFPESYAALAKQQSPLRSNDQIVDPVFSSSAIKCVILFVVVVVTNTEPSTIKGYEIEITPFALRLRLHLKDNGGTNGLAKSNPS